MVSRLFLVYILVELAVVVALASTIGLGWTLLLLLAAFVAGMALAGSQLKRQLTRLRSGLTTGQRVGRAQTRQSGHPRPRIGRPPPDGVTWRAGFELAEVGDVPDGVGRRRAGDQGAHQPVLHTAGPPATAGRRGEGRSH